MMRISSGTSMDTMQLRLKQVTMHLTEMMTPSEKRIIITKAIGECHRQLTASGIYDRAFIATATWMPVWHLMKGTDGVFEGPSNIPEDTQVKLQHLKEYNYAELFTREKILAAMKEIEEAKAKKDAERQQQMAERRDALASEVTRNQPYVEKAATLRPQLQIALKSLVQDHIELIHNKTGMEEFIIGGSWASAMIAEAYGNVREEDGFEDQEASEIAVLDANDIDVYHGSFTDMSAKRLFVHLDKIEYTKVDGLPWEINTVQCDGLNVDSLLENNGINVTASCIHVDFTSDDLFSFSALPAFWEFLFHSLKRRGWSGLSDLLILRSMVPLHVLELHTKHFRWV